MAVHAAMEIGGAPEGGGPRQNRRAEVEGGGRGMHSGGSTRRGTSEEKTNEREGEM